MTGDNVGVFYNDIDVFLVELRVKPFFPGCSLEDSRWNMTYNENLGSNGRHTKLT